MRWHWILLFPLISVAASQSFAQPLLPELRFTDPPGFYRSAIYPPADFSSQEVNASVQVYPFRVVDGDIRQAFAQGLLRELIDERFRELTALPGARLDQLTMPGADIVLRARFQDGLGQPRERLRLAFVRGNAVAIFDASAISMASWQHIEPRINAFAGTLHIAAGTPPPTAGAPPPRSAARPVAGVYMGFTTRYNFVYRQRMPAWFYYLFSADGRVYRTYDDPSLPGNDPVRFDFAAAQRADPVNSGQYTIQGNSMVVRFGPPHQPETFEVPLPIGNAITIRGVTYERQ